MSLESFYGGKQGLSSVIKKAFRYISTDDPAYVALGKVEDGAQLQAEALANNEVMEECFKDNNFEEV